MKEFQYVITYPNALATRGGTTLVNIASGFSSAISMSNGTISISAKSLLGVMLMPTHQGDTLTFSVDGPDEAQAVEAVEACLKQYL